jgi:hypothetical protein
VRRQPVKIPVPLPLAAPDEQATEIDFHLEPPSQLDHDHECLLCVVRVDLDAGPMVRLLSLRGYSWMYEWLSLSYDEELWLRPLQSLLWECCSTAQG